MLSGPLMGGDGDETFPGRGQQEQSYRSKEAQAGLLTSRSWVCLECEEEKRNKKEGGMNGLGRQIKSWDC